MDSSRRDKIIQAKILDIQSQMLLFEAKSTDIQGVANVAPDTDVVAMNLNRIEILEGLKNREEEDLFNELTALFKQWFEKPNQGTRVRIDLICITALGMGMDDYMLKMEARGNAG